MEMSNTCAHGYCTWEGEKRGQARVSVWWLRSHIRVVTVFEYTSGRGLSIGVSKAPATIRTNTNVVPYRAGITDTTSSPRDLDRRRLYSRPGEPDAIVRIARTENTHFSTPFRNIFSQLCNHCSRLGWKEQWTVEPLFCTCHPHTNGDRQWKINWKTHNYSTFSRNTIGYVTTSVIFAQCQYTHLRQWGFSTKFIEPR